MKRLLIALALAVLSLFVLAPSASAIHKGAVCREFRGLDGDRLGEHLDACASVNDHDFEDKIQAYVKFSNPGEEPVAIHVSYFKLVRGSTDVWKSFSFTYLLGDHEARGFAGPADWINHPNGTYHTRVRMWACWPARAGTPCGSVVAWNSQDVTY